MSRKVKIGFFSFTEVLDGRHREYNEWHLFDHLPENLKLDGLQWGQRWVATPQLMERRPCATGDLAKTQYVTLYLITEPVQQAIDEFYALGRELHRKGRWFDARKSHLSGPFRLVQTHVSPRLAFDADALAYRPHRGVFVTVHPAGEHAAETQDVDGVAGHWSFADDERTIGVSWLDEDPALILDDLVVPNTTTFASAYESIPWDSRFDWFDDGR